jgi:hypothetical protein
VNKPVMWHTTSPTFDVHTTTTKTTQTFQTLPE